MSTVSFDARSQSLGETQNGSVIGLCGYTLRKIPGKSIWRLEADANAILLAVVLICAFNGLWVKPWATPWLYGTGTGSNFTGTGRVRVQ